MKKKKCYKKMYQTDRELSFPAETGFIDIILLLNLEINIKINFTSNNNVEILIIIQFKLKLLSKITIICL